MHGDAGTGDKPGGHTIREDLDLLALACAEPKLAADYYEEACALVNRTEECVARPVYGHVRGHALGMCYTLMKSSRRGGDHGREKMRIVRLHRLPTEERH